MNNIIRTDIDYMTRHARICAKRALSMEKQERLRYLKNIIERDYSSAEGAISALNRAYIISLTEWVYARRVLKHHYCRLLSEYCDMQYMYKDDMNFYIAFVR